ncbi:MAG TPA: TetR family transcriptional regulator [Streptosporangiaceae bacterium]|nr:TetR family transcriptional regulator [Streptosporangiaceae bacterium]
MSGSGLTSEGPGVRGSSGQQRAARRRPARTGRRAGDSGSRDAILDAARSRFAEHGYSGATIRAIAADASVDPALVHHFYGTKERLFGAAMRLPVVPSDVLTAVLAAGSDDRAIGLGEHIARTALTAWEDPAVHDAFIGLLRSAVTSEQAATMFREFLADAILRPVAQLAGSTDSADAEYRAAMVASQMLGLAMARYMLAFGPVAAADPEDLAATIGPTLDRYLTGDVATRRR